MGRPSSPWFWEKRQRWYVRVHGVWHNLGEHPKGAPKPKKTKKGWNVPKVIRQCFHELMATPKTHKSVDPNSVAAILDDFLTWTQENRAEKTYKGYLDFCQSFLSKWQHLTTDELKPRHVQEWLNEKTTWNQTTKRSAITCLKRAFNWAVRNYGVDHNPIMGMEKPEANTRTNVVPPEEFEQILKHVADNNFKDLLIVSYDCGGRPQDVKPLEARHVDLKRQLWVLPREEAKGKRKPRIVYIPTKRALQIIRKRMQKYPEGPIFRNNIGNPWTGYAVKSRFEKLEKKLGKRYRHYDLRHTWITKKLLAGVDSNIVAALSGHSDTKMIDRVYSHVTEDSKFMLEQAKAGENA